MRNDSVRSPASLPFIDTRRRPGALLCCIALLAALTPVALPAQPSPEGRWEGAVQVPGQELGLTIDLTRDGAEAPADTEEADEEEARAGTPEAAAVGWRGTVDIPAQWSSNARTAG